MSHEQRLILEAVRSAFGQARSWPEAAPLNWTLVLDLADRQGLTPLVFSGLAAMELAAPGGIRTRLRAKHLAATARVQVHLEPLLRQLLTVLQDQGLEPIVLKGGALAYLAYPSPADRTMGDVDLLLPPDQIDRASEALRGLGFWTRDADPQVTHHLRPFYSNGSPLAVELHHRLLFEPHPYTVDLEAIRARSLIKMVAGVETRVLAPMDALFHVCVHLAASHQYRLFPLRSLTDVLAMTTHWHEGLDWDAFLQLVSRARAAGAVYWPLSLSRRWLGAAVPGIVLSRLAPPGPIRRAVAPVAEAFFKMNNQMRPGEASDTLSEVLARVCLYAGYSTPRLLQSLVADCFLSAADVAGDPATYSRSRVRYAAYLVRPARLARGLSRLRRFALHLGRT